MGEIDIFMGLDIGSATSKCVLLQGEDVIAAAVIPFGTGSSGPKRVVEQALSETGLTREKITRVVATGYGRGTVQDAVETKSEISCHAKGANFLCPGIRTVIDLGGQDAKVIRVDGSGRVESFVMNDKCAAGTGRFLEVMARVLELSVCDMEAAGNLSCNRLDISSTCTVFAESEVVSHLASSAAISDIVAGIHRSVAARAAGLAKRAGVQPDIVMTGGVAQNGGVLQCLAQELALPVRATPHPQLVGALGAALYARNGRIL